MRVRKGLAERRATKTVTAEAEVPPPAPPFTLRLFLQGWSLAVIAILVIGFAGVFVALGSFTSADFIALAVPLTALLVVAAVLRGPGEAPERRSTARGQSRTGRRAEEPWYWPSGRGAPVPVDAHAGGVGLAGGSGEYGPHGVPVSLGAGRREREPQLMPRPGRVCAVRTPQSQRSKPRRFRGLGWSLKAAGRAARGALWVSA